MREIKTRESIGNTKNALIRPSLSYGMRKELHNSKGTVGLQYDTESEISYGEETAERTMDHALSGMEFTASALQRIFNYNNHTEAGRRVFISKTQKQAAQKKAKEVVVKGTKSAGRSLENAVRSAKNTVSELYMILAAGSTVPVIVVIVICSIGFAVGSVFGIFFASEDTGSGRTMQTVVQDINEEYRNEIDQIKADNPHDSVRIEGSSSMWRDVLSVYAVIINTDPDNPQEVATLNDIKIGILHELFWKMNSIASSTETITGTVETEITDEDGNTETVTEEKKITVLHIITSHKTAYEMADEYGFDEDQKLNLMQLLDKKNDSMWAAVLYGIHTGDTAIIEVARSQIGNEGGEPYWSWYGFNEHVNWCACFVSWCANECGYIEAGIIPKHDYCPDGVQWFKDHGQWAEGSEEPVPGMLIYFDYDNWSDYGDQDGKSDHVGIVETVEDGWVYTIEGNSPDVVAEHKYRVGYYEILGYGYIE